MFRSLEANRPLFNENEHHRMSAICEDLPELHNAVTLDPALVDGSIFSDFRWCESDSDHPGLGTITWRTP